MPKPEYQPASTMLVQPSVRAQTVWTPTLIRSVLLQADSGSFRTLADLCDAILADDRVGTVTQSRVGGLLGLPLSFEDGGAKKSSKRAIRQLEVEADWWDIAPETEQYQMLAWAQELGFCWGRLEYVDRKDRVLPSLRFWHPRHVRFDTDTGRWYTRVGANGDREVEMIAGQGEWVFYAPYGLTRPWANGLWRGDSAWWLLKSYARDDWARHSEKSAQWVITSQAGTSPALRKELASDIARLGRDAAIGLPPGLDLKLVEASANTKDIYQAQIDTANTGFAISHLGQNLTTEVKGGSYAATAMHAEGLGHRVRADDESWSTCLHDQVLTPWASINFGNPELAPWPVRDTDPPEDEKAKAEVLVALTTAVKTAGEAGLQLDAAKLQEQFPSLPLAVGEDGKPLPIEKPKPPTPPKPPEPKPEEGEDEGSDEDAAEDEGEDAADAEEKPAKKGEDGSDEGASKKKAPPKKKPEKKARLASGFDVRNAAGFVEGQSYSDALADRGRERGAEALEPFLADLADWIDGVEDLETARTRLINFYRGALPPEQLAEKAEKLFILAQLGGVLAVRQDAPEIK